MKKKACTKKIRKKYLRQPSLDFYRLLLGHSRYPANNLVCIRRINRTTFHMSITRKFDKVIGYDRQTSMMNLRQGLVSSNKNT